MVSAFLHDLALSLTTTDIDGLISSVGTHGPGFCSEVVVIRNHIKNIMMMMMLMMIKMTI